MIKLYEKDKFNSDALSPKIWIVKNLNPSPIEGYPIIEIFSGDTDYKYYFVKREWYLTTFTCGVSGDVWKFHSESELQIHAEDLLKKILKANKCKSP